MCPRFELPEGYESFIRSCLPDDADALLRAVRFGDTVRALRINTLRISAAAFDGICPFPTEKLSETCRIIEKDSPAGLSPLHDAGLYYIQEPSAQRVAPQAQVRHGSRVLDLCAAPGGKSGHLAQLMENSGLLVSNEYVFSRAKILRSNFERLGVRCAAVTNAAPNAFCGYRFDTVVADAPCSGEGMFRRDETARREWSVRHAESCASRQSGILSDAACAVAEGGLLVYSTCTFNTLENEGVIEAFLRENPSFELLSLERLMPQSSEGEGHFIARMRCTNACGVPRTLRDGKYRALTEGEMSDFRTLYEDCFSCPCEYEPRTKNGAVFLAPDECYEMPSLFVPGVYAGSLEKHRFEPSHALFMSAKPDCVNRKTELDGTLTEKFLRGEAVPCDFKGYTAVTFKGFVLGFGKASEGMLKNKYPKGLRRQNQHGGA